MVDYSKNKDFFDPLKDLKAPIHVIGCGAIGSTLIEMLVRMGCDNIHVWDFDKVSQHNIANQAFFDSQIGSLKVDAISETVKNINPTVKLGLHGKYTDDALEGYVFLCVDSIDVRKTIINSNRFNPHVIAFFDFRMRLTDAQHYAAINSKASTEFLLSTMDFTSEEAQAATPVNACGSSLNIINTVRMIVSVGLSNFINFVKNEELRSMLLIDAFSFFLD